MFPVRPEEPEYAKLPAVTPPELNSYGLKIDIGCEHNDLTGKSLKINGDAGIGENPNRYKQHGFYFTADNCIACHACESACSEKNDLPAHLAFRAVGYIEGGTWPITKRVNVSMACNHCDNPVCLKGCPTRAYTKFAEYGAVLQDPNICFGCGYCTWVCPYNAPQLDPVKGQVEKCNMCVDRLEVGLKPACAAACLAGALDFGIIETTPENRHQTKTTIPGFPTPEITHPNIRFQLTQDLPREMTRTDAVPLRYVRDGQDQEYVPQVRTEERAREWGLAKLSTRENPLVLFTLASQAVVGAFLAMFLGPLLGLSELAPAAHPIAYPALLFALLGLETAALVVSTMHLGKPHRFYRAFNNLRYSPVSREVAGIAVFYNLLGAYTLLTAFPSLFAFLPAPLLAWLTSAAGWGAVVAGPLALYFMHAIYRIPARPFWNHWQVLTSFYGSTLALGATTVALVYAVIGVVQGQPIAALLGWLALPVVAGLTLEALGLWRHARDLVRRGGEGAASHFEQTTTFGKSYLARNIGLLASIAASALLALARPEGVVAIVAWFAAALLLLATSTVGRMLFYALVIPTTMPGAFFWRNKAFQEHAQKTGLASRPQTGVALDAH
jgi:DMSO reductase iron-sulfur subunit